MATILDKEKVLELLKDFNLLTGIRICLFDISFKEVLAYPEALPPYCLGIRSDAAGREKCRNCDLAALETARRIKGFYIYSCHAGFTEAVCPIRHGSATLGYLMFGHVRDTSSETIKAAAKIMESCAGYIYLSGLIGFRENAFEKRLTEYLSANISGSLTVDGLCREFGLPRVTLYALFRELYGRAPAEHIRALRLEHACRLLKTTNDKIAAVASESGFSDYNYFAKQFKKEFGISPGKYRAKRF